MLALLWVAVLAVRLAAMWVAPMVARWGGAKGDKWAVLSVLSADS